MFLGTWQLKWAKGLLGPLGNIPKIKRMCSLGALGSCNGQRGGRVACPHQECTNTPTCSVKGWWWPPAIQQTFITCRFHHMLFTYCKHGLCLKCITQFQAPGSTLSLYVSTSVSLSTASISIYLYRSTHLDMHRWFHECIDSWGLRLGGWLLSPKCNLGVNTCAWLLHGQTIPAKQLKRALALHNHTYTTA